MVLRNLIILFVGVLTQVIAQDRSKIEYSSFFDTYYFRGPMTYTLGGGATGYFGDIKKSNPSYIAGIGAYYKVWPRTYFGAQLNYLNLKGTDLDSVRNISFDTKIKEFYVYCRFNILDKKILKNQDIYRKAMFVRPYLSLGIGTLRYSATSSTTNPDWSKKSKPENVHYPKWGFEIPAGLGLSFFVSHRISINAEFNYRFPFTDYLDDVSARGGSEKDNFYTGELKIAYSPNAPKLRKRKKFKGPIPSGGGNGGGTSSEKPKEEKPAENINDNSTPTPGTENSSPTNEQPKEPESKPIENVEPTPAPEK